MNCVICSTVLIGKQTKYCGHKCWIKGWKLGNREKYLSGKKLYREKNREKILRYNRINRKPFEISGRHRIIILDDIKECSRCGSKERLNIHHIKPAQLGGSHNFNNLLVLCWDCHMLWHKKLGDFWKVDKPLYPPLPEVNLVENMVKSDTPASVGDTPTT